MGELAFLIGTIGALAAALSVLLIPGRLTAPASAGRLEPATGRA